MFCTYQIYLITKGNFFGHIHHSIKTSLTTYRIHIEDNHPKPMVPHNIHVKLFCTTKRGTKHIIADTIIPLRKRKWGKTLKLRWSVEKYLFSSFSIKKKT
jgi:hypothetical protein